MKKNIVLISLVVLLAVMMIAAPFVAGTNLLTPKVLKNTWVSDTVSLTFTDRDGVTAVCGDVTVEGTYVNGTTGTKLVIWFDLGESCPEQLKFLESTRENYLVYSEGEDQNGKYMEIDGVKYYKQS